MTARRPGAAARGGDRGSATVWMLALLPLVVLGTVAALLVAQAVTVRHRAALAADQAALAAAGRAARWQPAVGLVDTAAGLAADAGLIGAVGGVVARAGSTMLVEWRACAAARTAARANGARVVGCTVTDGVADVSVMVPARGLVGRLGGGHGRARAGPVSDLPDIPFDAPTRRTQAKRPSP